VVTALRATSRTIADYLQGQFQADPDLSTLFSAPGTMRVYLNTPDEMTGARAGLSVWLYRVARDESTFNRPPERISPSLTRRPPLPLRLEYLMTPMTHSNDDDSLETEQVILGKVLQCFHDHPQLFGTDLRDDLAGTDGVVTMRFEILTLDEATRIWDALDTPYRTSVCYEATVVEIETGFAPMAGPPVQVPEVELGISVGTGQ
jgi:hypothetical protein